MCDNLKNDLISTNKFQRKKALENLKSIIKEKDNDEIQNIFNEYQVNILKCFRDESEMCREISIELILEILTKLNLNDYYLTYIFPVVVERIGTPEIIEESEELRLKLVVFMQDVIKIYSKTEYLVPFLNDIIIILMSSLNDKHPKVKQACCECILLTSEALPKHFHMQCENLIKPLVKCLTHQHFRIRVLAVQCIGVIIMNGTYNALENTVTSLAERLFDQIPPVRRAVIEVSATLLMSYRDRYSYFHKILPLILTGLSDEVVETREYAENLWRNVGLLYLKENESDLKEELDFIENSPKTDHLRPNFGCRVLVQRNCSKIIGALCRELTSTWQDDIKVRCGQLLTALIVHTEENFTQHLQDVFPAIFSVCRKNDDASQTVLKAAKLIGVYIPPKTWIKFVADVFSANVFCGHLRVLNSILNGCNNDNLNLICDEVLFLLAQKHICHVREELYLKELMECCCILNECNKNSQDNISIICTAILGLGKDQNLKNKAAVLIEKNWIDVEDSARVCKSILDTFSGHPASWTNISSDKCIFEAILLYSRSVAFLHFEVLHMLSACLCNGESSEVKLTVYISLCKAIEEWNQNKCDTMDKCYEYIVKEIILPNLIWHAGRSEEALRTISIQTLCKILESEEYSWLNELTPKILPFLFALLEDHSKYTRLFAIRITCFLTIPDQENLIKIYQLLLSRLDDEYDVTRSAAVEGLRAIFDKLPQDFDFNIFQPHFEHLVETLLIHLDDEDLELRNELLESVEVVAKINASYVLNKLASMEYIFENKNKYEEYIHRIKN